MADNEQRERLADFVRGASDAFLAQRLSGALMLQGVYARNLAFEQDTQAVIEAEMAHRLTVAPDGGAEPQEPSCGCGPPFGPHRRDCLNYGEQERARKPAPDQGGDRGRGFADPPSTGQPGSIFTDEAQP